MSDRISMLTCDEADLLLSGWAAAGLDNGEHRRLRRHLAGCRECRSLGASYLRVADLLPLGLDEVEPPAGLRSRLLTTVHAEAVAGRQIRPATTPWWRAMWDRVPAGRGLTAAGALLTAGAVAAALVAVTTRPAPAPAVAVIQSCGLTAQPAACGTLRYDPTAQLAVLTVTGLPAVPVVDGRPTASYEVWLIGSNRSVSPAGFLTATPDGKMFTVAMNGDMSQVASVATTQEPFGGTPAPTGPELLRMDLVSHA